LVVAISGVVPGISQPCKRSVVASPAPRRTTTTWSLSANATNAPSALAVA
jgi:hypothetical protein